MKELIKYQKINLTKASGTAAGTYEFPQQLDTEYDECIGVEAHENSGSAENYQLGVRDDVDTHHHAVNKNSLLTSKDVAQSEKAKKINFPIKSGRETYGILVISSTTSADINVDMVFKLVKRVVER